MSHPHTAVAWQRSTRIVLRPLLESDIPLLVAWFNDPVTTRALHRANPVTPMGERRWLEKLEDELTKTYPSQLVLGIALTDGSLIGTMGLHGINWVNRTAVTGTTIGAAVHRGWGYATEAKHLLLDVAFNRYDLYKVYSHVIAFNQASLRYANRCGYVEEARLPGEHFRDGQRHDEVILAVYADAWRTAHEVWQRSQTT